MNNIAYCCIVQFHIHSPRIQGRVHVPVSERVDLESDSSWDGCESSTGYKASLGSGRPVLAGSHPFHSFRGVAVAVSAVETTEPLSCDKRRFCCSCCLPLQMLHLIGQHSRRLVALSLYRQQHQHKSWLDHCICTHMHTVSLLLGRTYITFLNRWLSQILLLCVGCPCFYSINATVVVVIVIVVVVVVSAATDGRVVDKTLC